MVRVLTLLRSPEKEIRQHHSNDNSLFLQSPNDSKEVTLDFKMAFEVASDGK